MTSIPAAFSWESPSPGRIEQQGMTPPYGYKNKAWTCNLRWPLAPSLWKNYLAFSLFDTQQENLSVELTLNFLSGISFGCVQEQPWPELLKRWIMLSSG